MKWKRSELESFLDSCNVPWRTTFGVGPCKHVDDLLAEINRPEIRIERKLVGGVYRAVRKARTVRILVTTCNPSTGTQQVLREIGYSYPRDLRNHARPFNYGASLSETIPLGKRAREWAVEALAQELGIPRLRQSLFAKWRPPEHKVYESAAYPGMLSDVHYTFFTMELSQHYQQFYYSFENQILSIFGWEDVPPNP